MRLLIATFATTLAVAASVQAAAVTIATFVDPTAGEPDPTPIFLYDATAQELTAEWLGTGLTLSTINASYDDVTFSMPAISGGIPGPIGAGQIDFLAMDNTVLLTIVFDSAELNSDVFGATEFLGLNDVEFSGAIITDLLDEESFGFSFANQTPVGGDGSFTATASFTSSAVIVPEPASLVLLGLGGLVAARRMRRPLRL